MKKYELYFYTPGNNFSVPKLINDRLAEQKQNYTVEYLIFAQNDIIKNMINTDATCQKYVELCDNFGFPFAMYQYYNNFNRILPGKNNLPNPAMVINSDKHVTVDLIKQYAYGFLIINTKVFIDNDYKFREEYPNMFYLQDMIQTFYNKKLIFSNYIIPEVHDSYRLFKSEVPGYFIPRDVFEKEKAEYFKNNPNVVYLDFQQTINKFKQQFYEDSTNTQPNMQTINANKPQDLNISITSDINKNNNLDINALKDMVKK